MMPYAIQYPHIIFYLEISPSVTIQPMILYVKFLFQEYPFGPEHSHFLLEQNHDIVYYIIGYIVMVGNIIQFCIEIMYTIYDILCYIVYNKIMVCCTMCIFCTDSEGDCLDPNKERPRDHGKVLDMPGQTMSIDLIPKHWIKMPFFFSKTFLT